MGRGGVFLPWSVSNPSRYAVVAVDDEILAGHLTLNKSNKLALTLSALRDAKCMGVPKTPPTLGVTKALLGEPLWRRRTCDTDI